MFDHVRRGLTVLLTALVLFVAPQVAHAAFVGSAAPALSVGTASLTEPASVGVTWTCTGSVITRGVNVTVTGSAGNELPGVQFSYALYRGTGQNPADTEAGSSRAASLSSPNTFLGSNSFRVTVQPRLQSWTGPTFSRTITC